MMSAPDMDETISERAGNGAETPANGGPAGVETALEAAPQPALAPAPLFDATPWPVGPRPAARPIPISRRLGTRIWTAALAVALIVAAGDRKSTRLNSSHRCISYAVFC